MSNKLLERVHQLETEIENIKLELDPPKASTFWQRLAKAARFILSNWGVIAFAFTICVAFWVYWRYGIGYLESQKTLSLTKKSSESYRALGDQLMLYGEFAAAKEAYTAALRTNPSNIEATRGLLKTGVLEPLNGQAMIVPEVEAAKIEHLNELLSHEEESGIFGFFKGPPKENQTYIVSYFRGLRYEEQKDYACAKKYYQKSKDENPKFIAGYIALAYVNVLAGDPIDDAIATLNQAQIQDTDSAIAANNLGYCYMVKTDFERAKELFEKSLKISPYLETYVNLGNAHRYLGNYPAALTYHHAALDLVQSEKYARENVLSGTLAINFMPQAKGDLDTPRKAVSIESFEHKRMLVLYEVSFDYAIVGNLRKADDAYNQAAGLDRDGLYKEFVANKLDSLRLSEKQMPIASARWFNSKRQSLPDVQPAPKVPLTPCTH